MLHRAPRRPSNRLDGVSDVSTALEAMSADELRSFVLHALGRLEDEPRARLEDTLLQRAALGTTGWRPSVPSKTVIGEIERFVEAARRVGRADPSNMDEYLHAGVKASLAGNQPAACSILGSLLVPIAEAEIDLGQHEIVDEVLTVDIHDCTRRYVAAVYCTSSLENRADAVFEAMCMVQGIAYLSEPIAAMEAVAINELPDLAQFLPRWIERLERESQFHRETGTPTVTAGSEKRSLGRRASPDSSVWRARHDDRKRYVRGATPWPSGAIGHGH